jgi:hypothetical protein
VEGLTADVAVNHYNYFEHVDLDVHGIDNGSNQGGINLRQSTAVSF